MYVKNSAKVAAAFSDLNYFTDYMVQVFFSTRKLHLFTKTLFAFILL